MPEAAIPVGPSGAPVWPDGYVGSITHTNAIAAAIVARGPAVRGLGLDLETDDPFDDAVMATIVCRPEELLPGLDPSDPRNLQRGKLIFVIKEAAYKLYRPLAGAFLEFHDLAVSLDESAGTFHAVLTSPERPAIAGIRSIAGVFDDAEGMLLALASLAQ